MNTQPNFSDDASPLKVADETNKARMSLYDNVNEEMEQQKRLRNNSKFGNLDSPPKAASYKKESFFSRLASFSNLKKIKSKSNSEPFLNSQFFDRTLFREELARATSIESLDLELKPKNDNQTTSD